MLPSALNGIEIEVVHITRDYFESTSLERTMRIPVELVLYDLFYSIKGKKKVDIQQEALTNHVYKFLHDKFHCKLDPNFKEILNGEVKYIRELNELPFVFDEHTRGKPVTFLDPSMFYKQFVYLWRRCLKFKNPNGHLSVSFTLNLSSASLSTELIEIMEYRLRLFSSDYIRQHGRREVPFIELQTVIVRESLKNYARLGPIGPGIGGGMSGNNSNMYGGGMNNFNLGANRNLALKGVLPESLAYPFDYIHTSLRNNTKKFRYINYGLNTDMSLFQYNPCWSVWDKKDLLGLLECEPYGLPMNEIEENNLGRVIDELVAKNIVWRLGSCKDDNTNVKKVTIFLAEVIPEILKNPPIRMALKEEWASVLSANVSYSDKIAELKKSGEAFRADGMRDESLFGQNKAQKKERQRKKGKICNKHLAWVTKEYEDNKKKRMEAVNNRK